MDSPLMPEGPVCRLEVGEQILEPLVRRWRQDLEAEDHQGYTALCDAITLRQARQIGIGVDDWLKASPDLIERADALLDQVDRAGHAALWDEPHALGWFHQHFGVPEREASNEAHTRHEQKHQSGTVTTQLYTPRWIADVLARTALQTVESEHPEICDPAVGGGQMLLAALDALIERGHSPQQAARQLHGVDLDARAVRVARRSLKLACARKLGRRDGDVEQTLDHQLQVGDGLFGQLGRFDIVVTNPPYMGSRSMPGELKERIREHFHPFHRDLYAAFIRRCHAISRDTVAILAQQTIWYLSRFAKARAWLLDEAHLASFMHLGAHAFANLSGEKANVAAFVQTRRASTRKTTFIDLRHQSSAQAKRDHFERIADGRSKHVRQEPLSAFNVLPGRVIAHGLPPKLRRHFRSSPRLVDLAAIPGSQNKTGKNRRYVRRWDEVADNELRCAPEITGSHGTPDGRWVFYSKGGRFAPWWGNWQNVVDWSDEARQFYATNRTSNLLDHSWWFREGICYTDFGGRTFNARWMPPGCLFDMAGPAIFPHDASQDHLFALLAVLNSSPVRALLNALNPSLHYQVRDLRNLPVPEWSQDLGATLSEGGRLLVEGMQLTAGFVPSSPRSQMGEREPDHRERVRAFVDKMPTIEHRLDRLVCELYGCPELLTPMDERPTHHYLDQLEL